MQTSHNNQTAIKASKRTLQRSTFDLINWPDYKKSQLVYTVSGVLGIYASFMLIFAWLFFETRIGNNLNVNMWLRAIFLSMVYGLSSLWMSAYGKRFYNHEYAAPKWYIGSSLLMFTLGNILALTFLGTFAVVAGVALSGAPMIGMLLFDKRAVIPPLVIGMALSMLWFFATYFGVAEYALILDNSSIRHENTAWLFLNLSITIPQMVSIFYIAWVYVDLWKLREQETMRLSQTDPLTQMANRRFFMSELDEQFRNTRNHPICLLMMDLDHFKAINDTYTHQVGDFVLQEAAQVFKNHVLHETHLLSRHGGEEFCLLMTQTSLEDAYRQANKLRLAIKNHTFEYIYKGENVTVDMGVSIGIHTWPAATEETSTTASLLSGADSALYQAKRTGRNKVCCATRGDVTQNTLDEPTQ